MIKINLLAEGKRPVVARKRQGRRCRCCPRAATSATSLLSAACVLGLLAACGWYLVRQRQKHQDQKDAEIAAAAERGRASSQQVIKEVEDYKAKKAELERKIQVINDLKENQRGPVRIMDEVSQGAARAALARPHDDGRATTSTSRVRRSTPTRSPPSSTTSTRSPSSRSRSCSDTTQQAACASRYYDFRHHLRLLVPEAAAAGGGGARGAGDPAGGRRRPRRPADQEGRPMAIQTGLEGKPWYAALASALVGGAVSVGAGTGSSSSRSTKRSPRQDAQLARAAGQDPGRSGGGAEAAAVPRRGAAARARAREAAAHPAGAAQHAGAAAAHPPA